MAESRAVAIVSFNYNPNDVQINVGDSVEWRNLDPTVHTVTASRGEFSSGSMRQGQRFRATFNVPGVYPYFCEPHETMRGLVSVRGTSTATTTTVPAETTTTAVVSTGVVAGPAASIPATEPSPTTTSAPEYNGSAARNTPTSSAGAGVVASGVMGEADQPSPALPIVAVLAAAGGLFGVLRRWRVRRADALRYGAAAATAATGLLHLQLRVALDYPEPIGTLLVVEAAAAALLATWLVARPWTRATRLIAIAAHAAALVALAVTRTSVGLFGFHEVGWDPSPQVPLAVTTGALAMAFLVAARPER